MGGGEAGAAFFGQEFWDDAWKVGGFVGSARFGSDIGIDGVVGGACICTFIWGRYIRSSVS